MWQSRAMFDVGRSELLRKIRDKQREDHVMMSSSGEKKLRKMDSGCRKESLQHLGTGGKNSFPYNKQKKNRNKIRTQHKEVQIPVLSAQLCTKCSYCNTSLSLEKLRRQEGMANSWLSRQKPVLTCCPNSQCRKPLPKCGICLLPMGCLNQYTELRREQSRFPRGSSVWAQDLEDDLSQLANLPFSEWFSWCMKCKHGGHTHHLVEWFPNHKICPVSQCDCTCQSDAIKTLTRQKIY